MTNDDDACRRSRWIARPLTIALTVAALLAALAAEVLREMDVELSQYIAWKNKTVLLLFALGLAFACVLVAAPLTHGVIGIDLHRSRGYAFFQPFAGGWRFVVLQIMGWSTYGLTVASFLYMFYAMLLRLPVLTGAMASAGFGGIIAQTCLFLSLQYFEKTSWHIESNTMIRDSSALLATAFIYSTPMIVAMMLTTPWFFLPRTVCVAVFVPLLLLYSRTYLHQPHRTGARSWDRVRHSKFWRNLEHYFSLEIISDGDLDPNGVYMMGYHPHGIYPFTTVWATRGKKWHDAFPSFHVDVLAASVIFYLPLLRDIAMWCGSRDATRESVHRSFSAGRSVLLVPGGEREMRENRPESDQFVLITRHKGFVRLALKHGTALVPVFGFGESRLLDNFRAKNVQEWFAKRMFYGMPHMPYGRFYSPIPNAEPMTILVGTPIPVPKHDEPPEDVVQHYHRLYFTSLRELVDKHKGAVKGYEHCEIVYPEFGESVARRPRKR